MSSSKREFLSGAKKRRHAKERKEKVALLLKKVPKLTSFFSTDITDNIINDVPNTNPSKTTCDNAGAGDDVRDKDDLKDGDDTIDAAVSGDAHIINIADLNVADVSACGTFFSHSANKVNDVPQSHKSKVFNFDPAFWEQYDDLDVILTSLIGHDFHQSIGHENFVASERFIAGIKRRCTRELFSCKLHNNEVIPRDWLIYSTSTGNVYCLYCKLLSAARGAFSSGYSDWKHATRNLKEHESSREHKCAAQRWICRTKLTCRIDSAIGKQLEEETQYWRAVLRRIVASIKFLCERGLALRGENEIIGSQSNGNYLGTLELISQFDAFMADHLVKFGNKGTGNPSYLSSTIMEEIVELMAHKVQKYIADEIKSAKYYSIITDSTPDTSHLDQLTFVFRYVNSTAEAVVVERFIAFEPIEGHTGATLANCVVQKVDELGLKLSDCRGQAYDNAANMSGKYNGLQAKLKEINPLIEYIPCAGHSLNLVGVNSVDCCLNAVNFFGFLQKLFAFCSSSTHRWKIVCSNLKSGGGRLVTLKVSLTPAGPATPNHARTISASTDETADTRKDALSLVSNMDKLEISFMTILWNCILQRFNATSVKLQEESLDLCVAVRLLASLQEFVESLRDRFLEFENNAKYLCADTDSEGVKESILSNTPIIQYHQEKRRPKKRVQFLDESTSEESILQGSDHFRVNTYNVIVDKLACCLAIRISAYKTLCDRFEFLLNLHKLQSTDIQNGAQNLVDVYPTDLDQSFPEEFLQFCNFVKDEDNKSPLNLLNIIRGNNIQGVFPNVDICLRIYLSLPATNCSGERSFSKMARIKNELRSSMQQSRLSALSLMAIESDILRKLEFDDIISDFAVRKSRRKPM